MTTPSFTQVSFRLRNDDGNETGATWVATQGSDATLSINKNYRCRFLIDETNNKNWTNMNFSLYYQKNGGGYVAAASGQAVKPSTSTYYTDGDNTTTQLTGGSGTYNSSNVGMDMTGTVGPNTGAANQYQDLEYCFQIDGTYVSNGDTINLRVYDTTSTPVALAAYTDFPVITVSTATTHEGAAVLAGTSTATAVPRILQNGAAVLAGTSTATGIATAYKDALSTLNATSTFIAAAILYKNSASVLDGTSIATASANVTGGSVNGVVNYQIVGVSRDLQGDVLVTGRLIKRPS